MDFNLTGWAGLAGWLAWFGLAGWLMSCNSLAGLIGWLVRVVVDSLVNTFSVDINSRFLMVLT